MNTTSQLTKGCPRCKTFQPITNPQCGRCGRMFNTVYRSDGSVYKPTNPVPGPSWWQKRKNRGPRTLRSLGASAILWGMYFFFYNMMFFDVSVPVTYDGRTRYVVNLDLMQQRELYVVLSLSVAVIGAIVFVAGLLKPGSTVKDLSMRYDGVIKDDQKPQR